MQITLISAAGVASILGFSAFGQDSSASVRIATQFYVIYYRQNPGSSTWDFVTGEVRSCARTGVRVDVRSSQIPLCPGHSSSCNGDCVTGTYTDSDHPACVVESGTWEGSALDSESSTDVCSTYINCGNGGGSSVSSSNAIVSGDILTGQMSASMTGTQWRKRSREFDCVTEDYFCAACAVETASRACCEIELTLDVTQVDTESPATYEFRLEMLQASIARNYALGEGCPFQASPAASRESHQRVTFEITPPSGGPYVYPFGLRTFVISNVQTSPNGVSSALFSMPDGSQGLWCLKDIYHDSCAEGNCNFGSNSTCPDHDGFDSCGSYSLLRCSDVPVGCDASDMSMVGQPVRLRIALDQIGEWRIAIRYAANVERISLDVSGGGSPLTCGNLFTGCVENGASYVLTDGPDGVVDYLDILRIRSSIGATSASCLYLPACDLNGDDQNEEWEIIYILDDACVFLADCDRDGSTDFFDLNLYLSGFEEDPRSNGCSLDINADGVVDFFDLDEFMRHYEGSCAGSKFTGDCSYVQ